MKRASLYGAFLVTGLACAAAHANTIPRYITLVHCDPHAADPIDWLSLMNLVEAAEDQCIKLTIQFSPPWVTFISKNKSRLEMVAIWHGNGHEISGHHHTLDHSESWDGYSNDEDAPDSDRPPGYLGDMQAWRWKVSELQVEGETLRTTASWDSDFPAGVPFQTGGDGGAGVDQATSQPDLKWINERPVWYVTSAALYRGGTWYNEPLEVLFGAAGDDDIFTIAFHPNDYHPDNTEHVDSWFAFLASQDLDCQQSRTAAEVLEPHAFTPGDINYDMVVDVNDLLELISAWGTADPDADVNADATVDVIDLLELIANWTS